MLKTLFFRIFAKQVNFHFSASVDLSFKAMNAFLVSHMNDNNYSAKTHENIILFLERWETFCHGLGFVIHNTGDLLYIW